MILQIRQSVIKFTYYLTTFKAESFPKRYSRKSHCFKIKTLKSLYIALYYIKTKLIWLNNQSCVTFQILKGKKMRHGGKDLEKNRRFKSLCMLRYQSWWSSNLWHNVLGVRKKTFGQLLPIMTNSRLEPGKIQSILTWKNLNGWKIAISCQKSLGNPLPIRPCTFSSVSEKLQTIVTHIRILFSLLTSMLLGN